MTLPRKTRGTDRPRHCPGLGASSLATRPRHCPGLAIASSIFGHDFNAGLESAPIVTLLQMWVQIGHAIAQGGELALSLLGHNFSAGLESAPIARYIYCQPITNQLRVKAELALYRSIGTLSRKKSGTDRPRHCPGLAVASSIFGHDFSVGLESAPIARES